MLTPAFDLSQNEEFLIVSIQVPYAKISDVEVHFEDEDFMFYCKPYHLKLNLPGKVIFQEEPSIKYDWDKRVFTILAPKAQKGEVFEGLDLVNLLLAVKKGRPPGAPLIEVLEGCDDEEEDVDDGEFDWTIEQVPAEDKFGSLTFCGQQCGFNNSYSFTVFNLKEEAEELFEVAEPQKKTPKMRTEERLAAESNKFDEDHYIADLYHDEEIQTLIKYNPEWNSIYEEIQNDPSISEDDKITFTPEEKTQLRKLPNKEYLLDKAQAKSALLGLMDILFAYAYNKRTTEGENTVGSAWVINRLSATLSWFEVYPSVQDVALTCIRRSLIHPLFRHFELSLTVLEDVVKIIKLGRKYVIKCLLEIHQLFLESEPRYILNDLYITDYIVWAQSKRCSSATFLSLAGALEKVLLTKGDIGLNLVDIETFAKIAWMAHENNLLFNKSKDKKKETKSSNAIGSNRSRNSSESALVSGIEKISLAPKSNDESELSASDSDDDSYYEICSSYTSDSSVTCSSVCGSDCSSDDSNDEDWETSSEPTSDDDDDDSSSSSNSDNNSYSCLLRKESSSERIL